MKLDRTELLMRDIKTTGCRTNSSGVGLELNVDLEAPLSTFVADLYEQFGIMIRDGIPPIKTINIFGGTLTIQLTQFGQSFSC